MTGPGGGFSPDHADPGRRLRIDRAGETLGRTFDPVPFDLEWGGWARKAVRGRCVAFSREPKED
jgi:hypothetical protein